MLTLHRKDGFNMCPAFAGGGEKHGELLKNEPGAFG